MVLWLYVGGLLLAVVLIGALASAQRRPAVKAPDAAPQIKWRCPICAYVFLEFRADRYVHCPRCDSLLDSTTDATGPEPADTTGSAPTDAAGS